jgi:hypothetical protein
VRGAGCKDESAGQGKSAGVAHPRRITHRVIRLFCRVPRSPALALVMQIGLDVQGSITGKDVLRHSFTILRLWGPAVYLRCIRAIASGRSCTFLEMLHE